MLQFYDRVLTSRSEATLVTLIIIVAFLFLMMGILDHARGRVLARAGGGDRRRVRLGQVQAGHRMRAFGPLRAGCPRSQEIVPTGQSTM